MTHDEVTVLREKIWAELCCDPNALTVGGDDIVAICIAKPDIDRILAMSATKPAVEGDDVELARDLRRHAFDDCGGVPPRTHVAIQAANLIESLSRRMADYQAIALKIAELEAPAEHLPEPMSSDLLAIIDELAALQGHSSSSGEGK